MEYSKIGQANFAWAKLGKFVAFQPQSDSFATGRWGWGFPTRDPGTFVPRTNPCSFLHERGAAASESLLPRNRLSPRRSPVFATMMTISRPCVPSTAIQCTRNMPTCFVLRVPDRLKWKQRSAGRRNLTRSCVMWNVKFIFLLTIYVRNNLRHGGAEVWPVSKIIWRKLKSKNYITDERI